jgi:hypothetical protein
VLLILLDDIGFGQFSAFGGGVPSPNIEKLAAQGLRYTRFHTTALCSPTRAALRENGIAAERVMLVAGPSPRNPKANYRIELMRLDAESMLQ